MSSEPKTRLKNIPLASIKENPVALRSVNKTDVGYQELVESIKAKGVLNAILVREVRDAATGEIFYGLVDGLQRYSASQDAGRADIPAQVVSLTDAEVLEAQVITNVHRIETKPVEYSRQLIRILSGNPTMTLSDLAVKLAKSPAWVNDRLSLNKLDASIAELVDDNKINLSNAYALAKLPPDEQKSFVDRAMTMLPQEFVPTVNARVKEIRDAKRQGRDPSRTEFTPVPHLQKLSAIKGEWEQPVIGSTLISETGSSDPEEVWKLALAWVLHMDPMSVAAAKAEDERRKAEVEAAKAKRKEERDAAKQQAAANAAATINA